MRLFNELFPIGDDFFYHFLRFSKTNWLHYMFLVFTNQFPISQNPKVEHVGSKRTQRLHYMFPRSPGKAGSIFRSATCIFFITKQFPTSPYPKVEHVGTMGAQRCEFLSMQIRLFKELFPIADDFLTIFWGSRRQIDFTTCFWYWKISSQSSKTQRSSMWVP